MGSHKLNVENRSLASSCDFVVVNRIPTKLLRYGLLERGLDIPLPVHTRGHTSYRRSHCHGYSGIIKSKTTSSLASAAGAAPVHQHTSLYGNVEYVEGDTNPTACSSEPHAACVRNSALKNILILVIPGNPGIIDYYEVFMQTLYVKLNQIVPVWGVSHAGHTKPPRIYSQLFDEASSHASDIYNLEGQIHHKVEFIRRYIPRGTRLILIGHSIGAYISLELMNRLQHQQSEDYHIIKSILIFPTIERMSSSPQGSVIKPLCQFRWVTLPPQYALYYTPTFVKRKIISWYFGGKSVPECGYRASLELFNPECTQNILYLAADELNTVTCLNTDVIQRNLGSLIFLYGKNDPWCPITYYDDMKCMFPSGEIYACEDESVEHAFVLESGARMAEIVYQWIIDCLSHSLTQTTLTITEQQN